MFIYIFLDVILINNIRFIVILCFTILQVFGAEEIIVDCDKGSGFFDLNTISVTRNNNQLHFKFECLDSGAYYRNDISNTYFRINVEFLTDDDKKAILEKREELRKETEKKRKS